MLAGKQLYRYLMAPGDPALGMTLDGWTLAFKGEFSHLEPGFLKEFNANSIQQVRIAILFGILLTSLFGVLDYMALEAERVLTMTIRYGILEPAIIIGYAVTFTSTYKNHSQILTVAIVVVVGVLLTAIIIIAPASVSPLYFAGNLLLIFYTYSFLNLRFIFACLAGWFVVGIYPIANALFGQTPFELLFTNMFFAISTSVLGMFVNYNTEFQTRRNFFLRHVLNVQRAEVEKAKDELEIKVEERTREARAAARAKADFLANMSHEIRTPMNGVLGMLDLLRESNLDAVQQGQVNTAHDSAQGLLHIINDVLDLSKIEAGKMTMHHEPAVPAEIVEQVCALLYQQARQKGLELLALPDKSAYRSYLMDAARFRQVLFNLIGNAVKFTNDGEVEIACNYKSGMLYLTVKDTGIGIAPEQQANLFDAFHQAESEYDRSFGGTGLGLTITRQLIELMEGEVSVQSEPGIGSEFNLKIPLEAATDQHEQPVINKNVHLALDNGVDTRTLENLLQILGCKLVNDASAEVMVCNPGQPRSLDLPILYIESSLGKQQHDESAAAAHNTLPLPVTLHTLSAALSQTEMPESAENPKPDRENFSGSRVLVVEDNAVNRQVAEAMLIRLGVQPALVESGKEALGELDKTDFDLILMDCQMPGMDGFATTEAIRQREAFKSLSRTAVVALTANAMAGDRKRCLDAGMDDYLAKPVSIESLEKCLDRWIPSISNPGSQPAN